MVDQAQLCVPAENQEVSLEKSLWTEETSSLVNHSSNQFWRLQFSFASSLQSGVCISESFANSLFITFVLVYLCFCFVFLSLVFVRELLVFLFLFLLLGQLLGYLVAWLFALLSCFYSVILHHVLRHDNIEMVVLTKIPQLV